MYDRYDFGFFPHVKKPPDTYCSLVHNQDEIFKIIWTLFWT